MVCDYLNFRFHRVFRGVGGWNKLIGLAAQNDKRETEKQGYVDTVFCPWEVKAARRLFALAEGDEDAKAFLAKTVAWADDRARVMER